MRKVVILSPYFPPSTIAGVHRPRHLIKHLPDFGWEPIVLCVDEAFHSERLDPGLAALVPKDIRIVKAPAIPAAVTRRFGIGDIGLRGYRGLSNSLSSLLRHEKIDAVLITGSPFYPFLLSKSVKQAFGIPVILDFQDPWVSAWGASRAPMTKPWAAHYLARLLEPRAVAFADFITSVSDRQNAELLARYPTFPRDRVAAIPLGGDSEDYDYLRKHPPSEREVVLPADAFNISYVGTMLPRSIPLLEAIFSAVREFVDQRTEGHSRIRLNFVGTSNQPNGFNANRVKPLAERHGIEHLVTEVSQRIPYLEALDVLANSDALMLIGSDEPHYTASKIYPALLSGRPYLGIFHEASSAYEILQRAGGGVVLGFSTEKEIASLTPAIIGGLRRLLLKRGSLGVVDRTIVKQYEAGHIAAQFASIFEKLVA
jgi:glycosyltransferase involved in cell wall biosynthesis